MAEDEHPNEAPNYYAIIPATVRYSKDLTPQEKLLYAEITALTNKEGYCWATNDYFAALYDLHKKTISRQINHLAELGFFCVEMVYYADTNQIKERRIYLPKSDSNRAQVNADTPIHKNADTPIRKKVEDNNTSINTTRFNKQQTPVVVRATVKKSKRPKGTAPDVSCLSFITELLDVDKLNILKKTDSDVPSIRAAYEMAKQQGNVESLTAFIIGMVRKLQNGEVSPPVSIKPPVKQSRFVNFEQRKIDFGELEQLELEQLKATMGGEEDEEFVNCFSNI